MANILFIVPAMKEVRKDGAKASLVTILSPLQFRLSNNDGFFISKYFR